MQTENSHPSKADAYLEAAFHVFCAVGLPKATMQMIASRAGVSRPALYIHFKSKDVIASACIAQLYGSSREIFADALSHISAPEDALLALVDALCTEPQMVQVLASAHKNTFLNPVSEAVEASLHKERRAMTRLLSGWLRTQVEAGVVFCPQPKVVSATCVEAIEALKMHVADPDDLQQKTAALALHLGRGFTPPRPDKFAPYEK